MKIHQIGPFTTDNGIIVNTTSYKPIEHPAILIDDEEDMPVMLNVGNADFVQKRFDTMVSRYTTHGNTELIKDLHVIVLSTSVLSVDDIATVFNAAMNCTGHPILHALCHMTNDITHVKEHIAELQKAGY